MILQVALQALRLEELLLQLHLLQQLLPQEVLQLFIAIDLFSHLKRSHTSTASAASTGSSAISSPITICRNIGLRN